MSRLPRLDAFDAKLLLALAERPRATTLALAETTAASRNTVHARLARYEERHVLRSFENRIDPGTLGYPLTAFISVVVTQRMLDQVADTLAGVPEVLEVYGVSGPIDLLVRVGARDTDDLYRIAGQILATSGVERTETALAMRRMVDYRVAPLLRRLADSEA